MKKMKSFWKFLAQREAFGVLGGIVTCFLISSIAYAAFTSYMDEFFADVFMSEREKVAKVADGAVVSELKDQLSFRFAVDAETTIGMNYIYMEDEETGEIVDSSDRGAFLVLRDRKTDEKASIYKVDSKYMQPVNKYDNLKIQDRFYYLTGDGGIDFTGIEFLPTIVPEFYSIRILDAYRGENEAFPGTVEVMGSNGIFDEDEQEAEDQEFLVDTITLKPENAEDYEFVSKSEDYTIMFIYVGNSYVPQISARCRKILDEPLKNNNEDYVTTCEYDGGFWPGRAAYYGKFRYVDAANKSYIIHYAGEFYFKNLALYVMGINVLILLFFIVVAYIGAKRKYNREKYQYSMESYRDNLIDVMAHDLRTPLMAMSGYAENLKEEANTEKRDYYIDAILNNTDHMSQIISRNLEMSKIAVEDIKKNLATLELVSMIQSAFDEYKAVLEARKITVNCNGTFEIKGSEAMMKTALENLVTNIVKYVDDEGTVDISVKGKTLTVANTTNEKIRNPKKMWDPFVRGDESRSNSKGTGLGLAIAKNVFEKHKLKSSIEYKDSRFAVVLVKKR